MNFYKLTLDVTKLAEITNKLGSEQRKRLDSIPHIMPDNESFVWVSATDLDTVKELIGPAIQKIETINFKDHSKVSFSKSIPSIDRVVPIFMNLVFELTELVGYKKVHVCWTDFEIVKKPKDLNDPEQLFIILNSTPSNIYKFNTLFVSMLRFGKIVTEVPTEIQNSFIKIKEEATKVGLVDNIIRDDNGSPIAIFNGNKIWITFNISGFAGGFEQGWYPTMIAREIISRALGMMTNKEPTKEETTNRKATLEACRSEFIKYCKIDLNKQKSLIEQELNNINQEIQRLETTLNHLIQSIREKNYLLSAMADPNAKDELLNKEFSDIVNFIPLLRSINFINNGIIFETEVIHLEGDSATRNRQEFERFPLGRYQVKLERGVSPYITNLTHRLNYQFQGTYYNWDHPHVKDHIPCLGNMGPTINRLISSDKWFAAIQYMIAALQSYNSNDGWSPVGLPHWQTAAENRYEFTDEQKDNIRNWVSCRHRMPLGLLVEVGQEVVARCPNTCPLKDNSCQIQGTGTRKGTIEKLYEDVILISWIGNDNKKCGCSGFTYDHVTLPNGDPIVQAIGQAEPDVIKRAEPIEKQNNVVEVDATAIEPIEEDKPHERFNPTDPELVDTILNNIIGMEQAREDNMLPTVYINGEDVPDIEIDDRWTAFDDPGLEPADDDIMEAFHNQEEYPEF